MFRTLVFFPNLHFSSWVKPFYYYLQGAQTQILFAAMMGPECDLAIQFRLEGAIGAVAIGDRIFVLFRFECCVKDEKSDSFVTVAGAADADEFVSVSVTDSLWIVSKNGSIIVINPASLEIMRTEHTGMRVHRVFQVSTGVGIVFDDNVREVACVDFGVNGLNVSKVLQAQGAVVCVSIGTRGFAVCSSNTLSYFANDNLTNHTFTHTITACCCVEDTVWIGGLDGQMCVYKNSFSALPNAHSSNAVTSIAFSGICIYSIDSHGVIVVWDVNGVPLGSFKLSQPIGQIGFGTPLTLLKVCNVSKGQLTQWNLQMPFFEARMQSQDAQFIEYLCGLLDSSENEFQALKAISSDRTNSVSVKHVALSYLPDAIISLVETREILANALESIGLESCGLQEDVKALVESHSKLYRESKSAATAAIELETLLGSVKQANKAHDRGVLRLIQSAGEASEKIREFSSQTEDSFEKRIQDLNQMLGQRVRLFNESEQRLRSVEEAFSRSQERVDEQETIIASQRKSIELLQLQMSRLQDELSLAHEDLSEKDNALEELRTQQATMRSVQVELERELDDLTQNEVTLLKRIRNYQARAALMRSGVKECLSGFKHQPFYEELSRYLLPLIRNQRDDV